MSAKSYEQHEFGQLIPKMLSKQFSELHASIEQSGVLQPIKLYQDKVLDGWNRYNAVQDIQSNGRTVPGVVKFEQFEGTAEQALQYVLSTNLARRHIAEDKRVKLALSIRKQMEKLKPEATSEELDAEAAAQAGTSKRTVQRATEVERKAPAEVTEAMKEGKIKPSTALKLAGADPKKAKKAIEKAAKKGKASKSDVKEATGVKDVKGRSVPKKLHSVFEAADILDDQVEQLKGIMRKLKQVSDDYPGCYTQTIIRNLDSVMSVLKAEQAAWICKACDATGEAADGAKKCNVCKGRGWHPFASGNEPKYD